MNLDDKIKGIPMDLNDIQLDNGVELLSGKGTIYLSSDGLIELKFFSDTPVKNPIEKFFETYNDSLANAGKILTDSSYYTFKGTAPNTHIYTCKRLYLGNHDNFKVYTGHVSSDLVISNDTNSEGYKIAKVEIPYKIDIPKNHVIETEKKYSDKWFSKSVTLEIFEIVFENQSIDIISASDSTTILIQDKEIGTIEKDIPLIIKSVEFMTATIIDRYAIEYENKYGTRREFRYFHKQSTEISKGQPPIWISSGMKNDFTELFSKFYYFLQNHQKHESINQTLARIISSQNSFITTFALTVSTAIETIIIDYFSKGKKKNSNEYTLAIKEIKSTKLSDTLKKRIAGMIGSIF